MFVFTPFLYLNRLLPEKKRIYFAHFRSDRIGHFSVAFYIRYAEIRQKLYKKRCLYCFSSEICNQFLAIQARRYFFVNRLVRYIIEICFVFPFLKCLVDTAPFNAARDEKGLTHKLEMPGTNYEKNLLTG